MKRLHRLAMVAAFVTAIGYAGTGTAHDWNVGDVFAAIGDGRYAVFDNGGNFKETISDGVGGFTTGCAFNNDRTRLHTTYFSRNKVIVYDVAHPHNILNEIETNVDESSALSPESIAFYADGSFTVGHAGFFDGTGNALLKYDSDDKFVGRFFPQRDVRGTDWHDPSTDQRTVFYTSEGRRILRFDVGTDSQLADFVSLLSPGGIAFALQILPPGDGSGGLIVADNLDIKRLNGAGNVVRTYDVLGSEPEDPGENEWFSLALDPNGTSFWAGIRAGDRFYRFNIETGVRELGPIFITESSSLNGLCVLEEPLTTSVKECAPEDRPSPEQCDLAKGGEADINYLVGYGVGFGELVICPCLGRNEVENNVRINIRDCTMDQNLRDQPDNCFAEGIVGFDDATQSQSVVGGSTCAIHCFSLDGRRICIEVCTQ